MALATAPKYRVLKIMNNHGRYPTSDSISLVVNRENLKQLEMVATLRSTLPNGEIEELGTCSGIGELYWPYIRLEPTLIKRSQISSNYSTKNLGSGSSLTRSTPRSHQVKTRYKTRSLSKMKLNLAEPRVFSIEVTCPQGWPLSLDQWIRVNEVLNTTVEFQQVAQQMPKKVAATTEKGKPGKSAKEKTEKQTILNVPQPIPGDAYVVLECALAVVGGAAAKRDDERDLKFKNARKLWAAAEPNRNQKGAQIRQEFCTEFMVVPPPPVVPTPSVTGSMRTGSTNFNEGMFEDSGTEDAQPVDAVQGPTPASETEMVEMAVEVEEETLYLVMPEALRVKFIPLNFLSICTKEKTGEKSILVTPDMAEAAKQDRHARIQASLERMEELQLYNKEHVIGRQRNRTRLLETLFVDATIKPEILEVIEIKEEAIIQEVDLRTLSATKKKVDSKKADSKKVDSKKVDAKKVDSKKK